MKLILNFNLGAKILMGFAAIMLVFISYALYTMYILDSERDQIVTINSESMPAVQMSSAIQADWLKGKYYLVQYSQTGESTFRELAIVYVDSTKTLINHEIETIEHSHLRGIMYQPLVKLLSLVDDYEELMLYYLELIGQFKSGVSGQLVLTEGIKEVYSRMSEISYEIDALSNTMTNRTFGTIINELSYTENVMANAINMLWVTLLIIFLLGIIISYSISSGISRSIKAGIQVAENISRGDLSISIDRKLLGRTDEIGRLSNAMDYMVTNLNRIVASIINGTSNIAQASQEMSSAAQRISTGANEQASAAEEVSSTMEEITGMIVQNTGNSQTTKKVVMNVEKNIEEGNRIVQETVESMVKIAERIRIINDIAFQTNILSLNAAVEATQAGAHGKGFGVVAGEVRKLATTSKTAADEIIKLTGEGVSISGEAGEMLKAIVPEIKKTTLLVEEITAASLEQKTGAEQINSALVQLNHVVQENAAAAEEMAGTSEELASQAEELRELIKFFRLTDTES